MVYGGVVVVGGSLIGSKVDIVNMGRLFVDWYLYCMNRLVFDSLGLIRILNL